MKALTYNITLAFILFSIAPSLAVDDTKLTESISRKFKVSTGVNVNINNKYGQVIINTWNTDSVVVNVQVTSYGKNYSDAKKTIDRVDFDFNQVSNFLTLNTVFDRSSGSFKELFNGIGDYSKSLLSKNKLTVDYEIFIPEKAALEIQNKFGDVYINRHSGPLRLEMSHGDLRSDDLRGNTRINLSFGKAYLKNIQDADLEIRAAELEIRKTANLNLTSSSSEINIGEAFSVKVDSRNDLINIGRVQVIQGSGVFSKINLGEAESFIDLGLSYGELNAQQVDSKFSKILIEGRSADIDLQIDAQAVFKAQFIAKDDGFSLDNRFDKFDRRQLSEKKGFSVVTGNYGNVTTLPSELTIKAQGGTLSVHLSEVPISTKKP